jgi:RHS repeat-associated protein
MTATYPCRVIFQNSTVENRLVELRLLNNTLVATYAVDGNSLRVSKVRCGDSGGVHRTPETGVWSGTSTWFIYAGTQLISEYEDAASATYSAGTNAGGAQSDSVSTILYQHADHLTTRLTTENSAQLSNAQRHYPYGEALQETGTANPSVERKFTTYLKEWETDATGGKLNYAVFRSHSARTGRFLMADPVRGNVKNPQRLNLYAYVTGDPTNKFDPKGLDDGSWDPSQCADNPSHPKCPPMLMEDGPGSDSPILFGGTLLGSSLINIWSVGYEERFGYDYGFLGWASSNQKDCARQVFEYGMNKYGLWPYVVGEPAYRRGTTFRVYWKCEVKNYLESSGQFPGRPKYRTGTNPSFNVKVGDKTRVNGEEVCPGTADWDLCYWGRDVFSLICHGLEIIVPGATNACTVRDRLGLPRIP